MKKVLIVSGIYPPHIGGPSQYAKNLENALQEMGHMVITKTYTIEHHLPTGIRHIFFFFKVIRFVLQSDFIIALDTFSVGFPTVLAAYLCKKKIMIRTGGDFLWEQYLERTKKKVLFRDFYSTEQSYFSKKERFIFALTKWTLLKTSKIIFSTEWQRDIFSKAYTIPLSKTAVIENYYGVKETDEEPINNTFIASTRFLVFKNKDILEQAFLKAKIKHPEISLFKDNLPYPEFIEKIKNSYAVILVSLGDISPNMILDAIRFNRPFICTREIGIYDRIKSCGIYVDPLDSEAITSAIERLLDPLTYISERDKVRKFSFTHTWGEIAQEFITTADSL